MFRDEGMGEFLHSHRYTRHCGPADSGNVRQNLGNKQTRHGHDKPTYTTGKASKQDHSYDTLALHHVSCTALLPPSAVDAVTCALFCLFSCRACSMTTVMPPMFIAPSVYCHSTDRSHGYNEPFPRVANCYGGAWEHLLARCRGWWIPEIAAVDNHLPQDMH